MIEPILVTKEQYKAIGFVFFVICSLYTMSGMFRAPHEREEDDESNY